MSHLLEGTAVFWELNLPPVVLGVISEELGVQGPGYQS